MRTVLPNRTVCVAVRDMQRSVAKALTDVGNAAASLFGAPPARCGDPHAGLAADSDTLASAWREVGDDLRTAMAALPLDVAAAEHAAQQQPNATGNNTGTGAAPQG